MSQPFVPGIGAVFSADIAVPEHEREMRFYSRVLSTGDNPLWREDLMNNKGTPIIGLGARTPEYAHLPLQWMLHIQVADVATSVQRALELGGKELMHVKGSDGKSQWAVLQDLNGATFGVVPIIHAEAIPSVESGERVGRIAWFDLTVSDGGTILEFYRQVVGWPTQTDGFKAGAHYGQCLLLGNNGDPIGAIYQTLDIPPELAHAVPPQPPKVWMIYLPVSDVAESIRRAEKEGGKISNAIRQLDEESGDEKYVAATVQDPVGVFWKLIQG